MGKCVFGFDFGTLSCRGVAIDLGSGELLASAESDYRHGVISGRMYHKPIELKESWFLQDPDDWIESMAFVSKKMLSDGNIDPTDVLGIGTDFTSCTLVPICSDGTPLCKLEAFRDEPNAWPKLWKHHGAQKYAEDIENYAKEHTGWLKKYFGNSVSSEWIFPKALQVAKENPEIYDAADYFIEAVDWIVYVLTGVLTRNAGVLGVNGFWIKGVGFPDRKFCRALDSKMEDFCETKLGGRLVNVGDYVGHLNSRMSGILGLTTQTVVASGHCDSAVTGCGAGVNKSGSMILVMGTSTCHQMLYKDFVPFDGVCSIAADGMIPGLYSYESGQPATGDAFQWFADNCVPKDYVEKAQAAGKSILQYLGEKAEILEPGESGLVALDWLNGNRSVLSNYNLSGVIVGLTLSTKPEEIYRALVEANLFGSRKIIENYIDHGVAIDYIWAVGGIAVKSPWIMQICADILKKDIVVPIVSNIPARGAAACAAVAVGNAYGDIGCRDFEETSDRLIPKEHKTYVPCKDNSEVYDLLYQYYLKLHDTFGLDDSFMKNLKSIRKQ